MPSQFNKILLFLAAALLTAPSYSTPRFESLLAQDTDMVMLIEDIPKLIESWPDSPLAKAWEHEDVQFELSGLRSWLKVDAWDAIVEEELGHSIETLRSVFTGQAVVAVPDINTLFDPTPAFAVMVAVDEEDEEQEWFEDLRAYVLASQADAVDEDSGLQYREIEEEYFDEVLYLQQTLEDREVSAELGWTSFDGVVVVAQPKAYLQTVVAALKRGEVETPWTESDVVQKMQQQSQSETADLMLYVDGKKVTTAVLNGMKAKSAIENANEDDDDNATNAAMQGFAKSMLENLVGDNIDGFFMRAHMGEEHTSLDLNLLYKNDQGFIKLMAYQPGPVQIPGFLPDDANSVNISQFSLADMWLALNEMGNENQAMGWTSMAQAQLSALSSKVGFDLEKALFDSLGKQIIQIELPPSAERPDEEPVAVMNDLLFAFAVDDSETLEMALESIKAETGLAAFLQRQDYLETALYATKPNLMGAGSGGFGLAYAITDRYLLIGNSAETMQRILSQLKNTRSSAADWLADDARDALDELPEDASALAVYEPSSLLHGFFQTLIGVQSTVVKHEGSCSRPSALEAKPFENLLLSAVAGVYKKDNNFRILYRFQHAAD